MGQWHIPMGEVVTAVVLELGGEQINRFTYVLAKTRVKGVLRKYFHEEYSRLGFDECCDYMIDQCLSALDYNPFSDH